MDSSDPSNGLAVFPPDVEDNRTDYKQRCKYLEGQLEKFREQATKVREVIGQKLKDLEQKSRDSEAKATETALQVKHLESLVAVKEETVAQLRIDLENEKQRRVLREREVEDKAAHIKGWMQKKMTEYEGKLRDVNEENDQLKSSQQQAMEMVKEIETKLHFSQEQVVRLSRELADIQSHCGDYAVIEPEGEETEESMCQSPLNSPDSEHTPVALFASPDGKIGASVLSPGTVLHGKEGDYGSLNQDEPVEISIKRTSSGKSPSKIPRYVGSSEDPRSAQISYYMSLKRGLKSPNDSKPKFFIQVQDSMSPNPYMHLMQTENQNVLQKKHFNSQSTVDSERDSVFEAYFQSNEENIDGFHAQTGDLVTLCLETRSLAPSMTRTEQDFLSESRSSLGSTSEPHVMPNPVYQTLEQTLESEVPLSPPPPPVPPRFDQGNSVPPPVPPVPKSKEAEVERTEGNFTSYLPVEEVSKDDKESNDLDAGENQSWNWNEYPGSDSPLFGTLEKCSKELNLLMEQTCPVYTTLKGRASQIRNIPFSGESTDSSDNESMADYCTPPDEEPSSEEESQVNNRIDQTIEGPKQVLKTCATYTTVNLKKEDQGKEGYLTKLGGRIKNWKRRWFVLRDGKLYYYKSQQDVNRKPLGQIPLDGTCRIARTEGALTFEVATPKRTFYLTGETREVVDEWLRVLHNVMRKFSTTPLFAQVNEKEIMRGSLTKVKHGASKKCWCVLRGQYLCFYKSEDDAVPFSMTNMIDVIVEEFESPDSEDDHDANPPYRHYTLVMKSLRQPSTTYLLIDSKTEKDSWLFHLKVASGSGIDDMGTAFEKSIFQLIAQDCDPESDLWNSYVLTHVKEPISEPLTTLPSKELENEALKLFKSVHLFTTVQTEEAAIDYHVSLAQNALQTCLNYPELQNEVYCQLIKQTSKHVHRGPQDLGDFLESCGKSSWLREDSFAIASQATIDLRPVQEFVYIQAWQLLALCTSIFVPKQKFLLFLKGHLNRNSAAKTKVGKFANYCLKNLARTLANGKRETRPSRMEVISVLIRKPYDHSCPMSIPVHFIDGTSQVFGFDGSTTVQEFTRTINMVVGIRAQSESGYALFTDNPVNLMEHCLQSSVKLCDVISKWEQAMRSQSQGKLDTSRIIKLTYKNRLYFKSLSNNETDKEKFFLVLQANANIVKGRFPVSKEMALELAALMAQITYGDYRAHSNSLPSKRIEIVISKFCAKTILEDTGRRSLTLRMAEKWSTLHGWSLKESVDKYLENTRRWPFFGCKLFQAQQKHTLSAAKKRAAQSENTQPVWLAVEEDSINILEGESLRLMCRYKYKNVVTFGGWKDDFMLVVNQSIMRGGNTVQQGTQRLLFVMSKGKILELTLLMASYINAIIRQKGITCDVSETPPNRQGMDVKVWDLESSEWPIVPGATVGLL